MSADNAYADALDRGRSLHRACEDAWQALRHCLEDASGEITRSLGFPVELQAVVTPDSEGRACDPHGSEGRACDPHGPEGHGPETPSYQLIARHSGSPSIQRLIAEFTISSSSEYPFHFTYEPLIEQLVRRSSEFKRVIINILGSFHAGKMFDEIVEIVLSEKD